MRCPTCGRETESHTSHYICSNCGCEFAIYKEGRDKKLWQSTIAYQEMITRQKKTALKMRAIGHTVAHIARTLKQSVPMVVKWIKENER